VNRASAFLTLLLAVFIALYPVLGGAQYDPVGDLQRQDAELGLGCNEIGLASTQLPALNPPQTWLDEHAICLGGDIRAVATCTGGYSEDRQLELCLFFFLSVNGSFALDCSDITLLTENGPFGPDPELTDDYAEEFITGGEARRLPEMANISPCTTPVTLAMGQGVLAAFDFERTERPFALRAAPAPGALFAFIVEEPRQELAVES
jgi:hypothetical protein